MNIGKIYHESTRKLLATVEMQEKPSTVETKDGLVLPEGEESSIRLNLKHNWLQSTITQEMLKDISNGIDSHIDKAISMATTYGQHGNHHGIISELVRADLLRKFYKEYSKLN